MNFKIENMMVAIPASDIKIDTMIDDRFGRCPFFCFYNTKTKHVEFKENKLRNASEGVGPQVVEFLAKNGIQEVYAVEIGPKAQKILDKLNIKTTIVASRISINQILNMLHTKK